MGRAMGMFPYYQDEASGPGTSGTLASVPTGRDFTAPAPADVVEGSDKNNGNIIPSGISETTDLIFANKVQYGVFGGDA